MGQQNHSLTDDLGLMKRATGLVPYLHAEGENLGSMSRYNIFEGGNFIGCLDINGDTYITSLSRQLPRATTAKSPQSPPLNGGL
ncbi:hypothetical protein A3K63_05360 [Candidatus Micrarchaeota archaeon RBG_16_49_10]|nr:MAG: hypothetical protein A3K63_05360 [Candidatus Micrarchaeota archaeon RBG_16_49_10]